MSDFYVDDVITASADDWWGGVSSRQVREWLAANKGARELTVRINSVGGDAFEGVAIYNALKQAEARIIIEVEGQAASAASVIAMAGDEIRLHKGAQFMIHEAQGFMWGDADAFDAKAKMLRTINSEVADIYAARTGSSREECLQMMADETWMAADDAKKHGFCDVVVPAKEKVEQRARPQSSVARQQAFMSMVFKRAPAAVAQLVSSTESNDMNEQQILIALGFASMVELTAAVGRYRQFEAATGKGGDEAVGVMRAAMTSHAELPKLRERCTQLEAASETHELDKLITKAKEANKLTPALEASVRDSFAKKEVTLKGVESWLENTPVVAALAAAPKAPAPPSAPESIAALTHNGKTWAQLTGSERVDLLAHDKALYTAMRDAARV